MRSRTKRRTGLKIRATWHWTHGPTSRAHTQPEDPPVSSCSFALCVAVAPVSFTFVPCAMRCTAPVLVFFFLLSSIRFPRAPAYRFQSFSTAFVGLDEGERSCEVMISVTQFLVLSLEEDTSWSLEIRLRKCRWIWSRNFFFFRNYFFRISLCSIIFL